MRICAEGPTLAGRCPLVFFAGSRQDLYLPGHVPHESTTVLSANAVNGLCQRPLSTTAVDGDDAVFTAGDLGREDHEVGFQCLPRT